MDNTKITEFLTEVVEQVQQDAQSLSPSLTKSNLATESEKLVFNAIHKLKSSKKIQDIMYEENSHQFPDIVIKFNNGYILGIEIKSSSSRSSSWAINGNSILGSTRIDVNDTYIVFIKSNHVNSLEIRFARYQDSISDIVVTHSPRYKIDLNINPSQSFFQRSGIEYNTIINSDNPIALVTKYFRKEGKVAWWLNDNTNEKSSSATILAWQDIDEKQKEKIYGEAFVLFPEVINGSHRNKYSQLAKWLAATYSIADSNLRDKFSAGGQRTIQYDNKTIYHAPRVYTNLQQYKSSIETAFSMLDLSELTEFWTNYSPAKDDPQTRKNFWLSLLLKNNNNDDDDETISYIRYLFEINTP